MKNYLKVRFVAAFAFFSTSVALAHGGEAPHGGTLVDFGGSYHLEGKVEGSTAHFYLLGENGATTITKHSGGSITVLAPGKGAKTIKIAPDTAFSEVSAPIDGSGKVSVQVKIVEGATKHSASFKFNVK